MRILDTIRDERLTLSFEVFPPKTDAAFEEVLQATEEIAALKPSFISCGVIVTSKDQEKQRINLNVGFG